MLSSMLEASRRRRQRRTWKHGAIKYVALGAIMLFLCLLYAKQGEDLVGQSDSSISSFVSTSTFRTTFAEPESQEGEAEDDGGGCDRLKEQNATTLCAYIQTPGNCDDVMPYVDFYYCGSGSKAKPGAWVAFILLLVLLFYLLATAADQFFTPTLEVIGDALKMSPEVAGLTILALGNGAPDLSTAISSLILAKPIDIVTGGLFGAAMFVSSIVVAAVAFIGKHVKLDAPATIRDICFYLVGSIGVYFITWDGKVYLYEAILFIVYYFAYVAFALITHYCSCCGGGHHAEREHCEGEDHEHVPAGKYGSMSKSKMPSLLLNPGDSAYVPIDASHTGDLYASETVDSSSSSSFKLKRKKSEGGARSNSSDSDEHASLIKRGDEEGEGRKGAHGGEDSDEEDDDDTPFTFAGWLAWWKSKTLINRIWIAVSSFFLLPMHMSVPSMKWNRYTYSTAFPATVALIYLAMGFYPSFLEKRIYISWSVCMGVSIILSILIFLTSSFDKAPRYKPAFVVLSFFTSIVWISMVADQLVSVLQSMGVILGIPEFVLGATVLAWGNSVGDLVADIVMAQKGFPGSALSAAWAGPMMNMLIGMGIGLTVRCATVFPAYVSVVASKSFLLSGGFLFLILYGTLIILWIRKWTLDWWWGVVLVFIYVLFNLFTGLIEGGVIWKAPL